MKLKQSPLYPYLLVNLATLLWASNIALGRLLRDQAGPVTMVAARVSVAGLVYLVLFSKLWKKETPHLTWKDAWLYFAMGLTGVAGYPVLMFLALHTTTATHVALINAAGPLVTMLLASLILKETITSNLLFGGMFSLAGVVLIISNGNPLSLIHQGLNQGDMIILIINGLWGLYSVIARVATRTQSSLRVTMISTWMAIPLLLPAAGLELHANPPSLSLPLVLAFVYMGIFPMIIAFLFWNESVRLAGPNQTMAFYNMLAVYGATLGILFLKEPFSWEILIGGALVVGGGLVVARKRTIRLGRLGVNQPEVE